MSEKKIHLWEFPTAYHLDIKWHQIKTLNESNGPCCVLMCYYAELSEAESDKISLGGKC